MTDTPTPPRADQAAPSAPAEVEGLTDAQKIKRMADLNWKPASQYWKEQHDAKSTALTALQAENERLQGERDDWKANAEALAKSIRGCGVVSMWATAIPNALAAHAKLKGDV